MQQTIHTVSSLGEPVGKLWQKIQAQYTTAGHRFNIACPLSSTPLPIYDWVIQHKDEFPNWDKINFVLMDEMVEGSGKGAKYISMKDSASYERFAREHFLDILHEGVAVLKPNLPDFKNTPSIDLLILALGVKGNYANVMPGITLKTGWHIAHLIPEFRQAHTNTDSASYANAKFREYGMSLGPQQVLQAKHVAVIIGGASKKNLTNQLLSYAHFDPAFPLSIVHHPLIRERVEFYITNDVLGP